VFYIPLDKEYVISEFGDESFQAITCRYW